MPPSSPTSTPARATRRNLSEEITELLRRAIVSGELAPGSTLAEPVLADRFGASRAPIREALIALERDGLVEFNERSRTRVRALAAEDIEEICSMRVALEGLGARLAARHWTPAHTRWMEENLRQQETAATLGQLSHLDVAMHAYVVRLAGHRRLAAAWETIRWQFEMFLAYTHRLQARLTFEPRRLTVDSHRQLLAALRSGDAARAEKAMTSHIESSLEWSQAVFPAEPAPAPRAKGWAVKAIGLALLGLISISPSNAADGAPADYDQQIRPLLAEHCHSCHSAKKQKGDLDLEQFASIADVKKQPKVWESVLEQLATDEMPPKKEKPLPPERKKQLTAWVQTTLDEIALAHAGDPGPVVLRRLSNAEYTYTVQDLTGLSSLQPAREFPVDGAAGEGFTNAGAALVMSPALLTKYFAAAKEIAGHAVLVPDGIEFLGGTTPRDWTDELLGKIRAFYAAFTLPGGAIDNVQQGVKLQSDAGGRLPVERYFAALVTHRDALWASQITLTEIARTSSLSPKYLELLWQALNGSEPSLLLDPIRARFRQATPQSAVEIAQLIRPWQEYLWRFSSVGHIGKKNGPKAWQQPWTPLDEWQELRVKLTPPADGSAITVYLAASDPGLGPERAIVQWANPRLVIKKQPEVSLRDIPGAVPDEMQVTAPAVIAVRIPAELAKEAEFVITAGLAAESNPDNVAQVQVLSAPPETLIGLTPGKTTALIAKGLWSDNNVRTTSSAPLLIHHGSTAQRKLGTDFEKFRQLFPLALCYTKIVPVDEVVTLTLYYREDAQLKRLMLTDAEAAKLDRLWEQLRYVSEWPLKQVDVFEQLYQFATQDADPSAFEPLREPVKQAAAAFREEQLAAEPKQVQAVLELAARAWRRPLRGTERTELLALYQKLRRQELPHEAAIRMMLVRVLVSPALLYRGESAAASRDAAPVGDWELATRLSYFLTSSAPDTELTSVAKAGQLHYPATLAAQAHRLLASPLVRRLATEFGCQWLHVRDLETLDEKSERHFPTFAALRGDMQEEVVRFFTDLFQQNRSVLSLLDADYTFTNAALAEHYGFKVAAKDWQRVGGLHAQGRGGLLGFAATLAKQSGASRTSPILRGNWISEVLLGDKLPRPPKGVPILPEEAPAGLTERQLIERHSTDAACARCHERIDPFGFALEGFDAIGRARSQDAAGQLIDTHARLATGTPLDGLDGLRAYLLTTRRDDFLRQFCRKLLGYALGRGVLLSDKPLLEAMVAQLKANDFHVQNAIDQIVTSRQFREVRGRDFLADN